VVICWKLVRKRIKTDSHNALLVEGLARQLPLLMRTTTVTMNLRLMVMGSCRTRAALTTSEPVH